MRDGFRLSVWLRSGSGVIYAALPGEQASEGQHGFRANRNFRTKPSCSDRWKRVTHEIDCRVCNLCSQ